VCGAALYFGSRRLIGRGGQRRPAGYRPGALPRQHIVGDARKYPAQLDDGRHLPAPIEGSADRGGLRLGDGEHGGNHGKAGHRRQGARRQPAGAADSSTARPTLPTADIAQRLRAAATRPQRPPSAAPPMADIPSAKLANYDE
jgi:hypothetical protein